MCAAYTRIIITRPIDLFDKSIADDKLRVYSRAVCKIARRMRRQRGFGELRVAFITNVHKAIYTRRFNDKAVCMYISRSRGFMAKRFSYVISVWRM